MKKNKWFILFAIILAVGFTLPLMAKQGGVKVDSDPTCDQDRQDNTLCSGWIWLNTGSDTLPSGSITCEVCSTGTNAGSCHSVGCSFSNSNCTDTSTTYFISDFDGEGVTVGTWTLKVNLDGKNLGGDSFRCQD